MTPKIVPAALFSGFSVIYYSVIKTWPSFCLQILAIKCCFEENVLIVQSLVPLAQCWQLPTSVAIALYCCWKSFRDMYDCCAWHCVSRVIHPRLFRTVLHDRLKYFSSNNSTTTAYLLDLWCLDDSLVDGDDPEALLLLPDEPYSLLPRFRLNPWDFNAS